MLLCRNPLFPWLCSLLTTCFAAFEQISFPEAVEVMLTSEGLYCSSSGNGLSIIIVYLPAPGCLISGFGSVAEAIID